MRDIYYPFREDTFITMYWLLRKHIEGIKLKVDDEWV